MTYWKSFAVWNCALVLGFVDRSGDGLPPVHHRHSSRGLVLEHHVITFTLTLWRSALFWNHKDRGLDSTPWTHIESVIKRYLENHFCNRWPKWGIRNKKFGKVKRFQVWVVWRFKGTKPVRAPGPYRVNEVDTWYDKVILFVLANILHVQVVLAIFM